MMDCDPARRTGYCRGLTVEGFLDFQDPNITVQGGKAFSRGDRSFAGLESSGCGGRGPLAQKQFQFPRRATRPPSGKRGSFSHQSCRMFIAGI